MDENKMNNEHLNDFIDLAAQRKMSVGDLVSYYETKAQELCDKQLGRQPTDYQKAYLLTIKQYRIGDNND